MTHPDTAATILSQLGGNRFLAMTGASYLMATPQGLQFTLPARMTKAGINRVVVELNHLDTYTLTFYRITKNGMKVETIAENFMIYAGELCQVFTHRTGLACAL